METHKSGEHARVVLCRIEYDLLLVKPHVVQTKTTNFQTKNTLLTQQKPHRMVDSLKLIYYI